MLLCVFFLGQIEIEKACDLLFKKAESIDYRYEVHDQSIEGLLILPLYGSMSTGEMISIMWNLILVNGICRSYYKQHLTQMFSLWLEEMAFINPLVLALFYFVVFLLLSCSWAKQTWAFSELAQKAPAKIPIFWKWWKWQGWLHIISRFPA